MAAIAAVIGGGVQEPALESLLRSHLMAPTAIATRAGSDQAWLGHVSLGIGGEDGGVARRGPHVLAVAGDIPGLGLGGRPLVEHLLDRVTEQGPEALSDLNGNIAACLFDERDATATLVNDRLGIARLYYRLDGSRLLIASRARALASGADFDAAAVGQVLQTGFPLGDRTLFPGVRLLPPASLATWHQGQLLIRRVWEPPVPVIAPPDLDHASEVMEKALAAAVARAIDTPLEICLPLSGGLDSRALLGLASRHRPLVTMAYGHGHSRDRRYASEMARIAGTRHHRISLGPEYVARYGPRGVHLTDGQALVTMFHILSLNPRLALRPSLVLSGLLGEIYSGAHLARVRPEEVHARREVRARALFERRYLTGFKDEELPRILRRPVLKEAEGAAYDAYLQVYNRGDGAYGGAERAHLELRMHRFTAYQAVILGAAALVRTPFADHEVIDAGLTLPVAARHGQRAYTHFIKRFFPDLARVPHTSTGLPLAGPAPVLAMHRAIEWVRWRGLRSLTRGHFSPHDYRQYAHYDEWIRTGARAFFSELIEDRSVIDDLVDVEAVADLLKAHLDRKVDAHDRLAAVATLALLRRQLRDGHRPGDGLDPVAAG